MCLYKIYDVINLEIYFILDSLYYFLVLFDVIVVGFFECRFEWIVSFMVNGILYDFVV